MAAAARGVRHRVGGGAVRDDPRRHRRRPAWRSPRAPDGAAGERPVVRGADPRGGVRRHAAGADAGALPGRHRAGRGHAQRRGAGLRVRSAAAASLRDHADHRLHPARRVSRRAARRPGGAGVRLADAVHGRRRDSDRACAGAGRRAARVAALPGGAAPSLAGAARGAPAHRPSGGGGGRVRRGRGVGRRGRAGRSAICFHRRCGATPSD